MRIIESKSILNNHRLSKDIFFILSEIYAKSPWSKEQILSDIKKLETNYYLVYKENKLIAFLATQTIIDEMEITNLAVLPEFQRKGIAAKLMNELQSFQGKIFLEVRESNQKARQLYEKFGFSEFNQRKNYYSNPVENAVLMKKENE